MTSHNPIAKARRKPGSLRLAVNAHCYMCMGGDMNDFRTRTAVISDIRWCHSRICPLVSLRGFTPSNGGSNKAFNDKVKRSSQKHVSSLEIEVSHE